MRIIFSLFFVTFIFFSCKDDDDTIRLRGNDFEIEDFIWQGLNSYYFWQNDVLDLADDRFETQKTYASFLASFDENHNELFESLLYESDRFSWIVSDYVALENQLNRVYKTSGMMIKLMRVGDSDNLLAIVRYVLPNSDAASKNIQRGDIFFSINNEQLTIENYRDLLSVELELFSIQLAELDGQNIIPSGINIDLIKSEMQENPVHISKIIELKNEKVGYLMYNGFVTDFDIDLENSLVEFKNQGIDHLVIDLRYNRGGRTSSTIKLASMITGQFLGNIFAQTQHNEKLSSMNEKYLFEETPVQLNMNKLYIISSSETASASELLINGLSTHIEVILVGDYTTGKNVGSYTIYDWIDNNGNKNPRHTWAMQPIALKIANSEGFADFENGLQPNYVIEEDINNLGKIGEIDEPLLEKTLEIIGLLPTKTIKNNSSTDLEYFKKIEPLQPAIMSIDLPIKMSKINQQKHFFPE